MGDMGIVGTIVGIGVLGLIYFAPSLVAHDNEKKNETAILVLNIFLGWTIIGWVIALVWALMKDEGGK